MTTPTRSMARMAHSPPRPPPSATRLEQESDCCAPPSTVLVAPATVEGSLFMPIFVVEGSVVEGGVSRPDGWGEEMVVSTPSC